MTYPLQVGCEQSDSMTFYITLPVGLTCLKSYYLSYKSKMQSIYMTYPVRLGCQQFNHMAFPLRVSSEQFDYMTFSVGVSCVLVT